MAKPASDYRGARRNAARKHHALHAWKQESQNRLTEQYQRTNGRRAPLESLASISSMKAKGDGL